MTTFFLLTLQSNNFIKMVVRQKFKLDQDLLIDSFFESARLLGITAPIATHLFCWKINNELGTDFRLKQDCNIRLKKSSRDYYFNVFEWIDLTFSTNHNLYNNKDDGEYLLPEFRNIDYLWLIKGDMIEEEYITKIKNITSSIDGVQFVVELTNEKIKNKGHLIL